jgi:serine/threonine-protein kinase
MAPEQCLGRDLDARTDVFALGVCLFEALTGRGLYRRGNDYDTLHAIIQEPVPSVRDIDARVPEALDHIVRRALQKRPGDRFDNAQAMQLALEQYLAEERELVSSALVGRMMRGLFAEEIVRGPTLEPLPSASTDDPAPEIVLEESGPRASHSARIDEPPAAHGAPPAEGGAHAPRIPTLRGPLLPDDDVVVGVDARPPVKSGTGGAFFLALLVLAALVGAAAVVSYRVGVLRIDAPANAPDTVAPAATADEAE